MGERAGRLVRTELCFASEAELRHAIERILAPLGQAEPLCDTRLPEVSHVADAAVDRVGGEADTV